MRVCAYARLPPALPDNRDIQRVCREAADHGANVEDAPRSLERGAGPVHPTRRYNAINRFFATDTTSIYATAELARQYREAESFLQRAQN